MFLLVQKCALGSLKKKTLIDPAVGKFAKLIDWNCFPWDAIPDAKEEACGSIALKVQDWGTVFQYHNLFAFIRRKFLLLDYSREKQMKKQDLKI